MDTLLKSFRRVGKQTFSFNYIITLDSLIIQCDQTKRWYPSSVVVVMNRSVKRFVSRTKVWKPGVACPFRSVILWSEPETIEFSLTLYKYEASCEPFEEKIFEFIIYEDKSNGNHREIARCSIDLSVYATPQPTLHYANIRMAPSFDRIISCQLDIKLFTVFMHSTIQNNLQDLQAVVPFKTNLAFNEHFGSSLSIIEKVDIKQIPIDYDDENNSLSTSERNNETVHHVDTTHQPNITSSSSFANKFENNKHESYSYMHKKQKTITDWCDLIRKNYNDTSQTINLTTSWKNGMLFCQIIHYYLPDKINMENLRDSDGYTNLKLAYDIFKQLKIPNIVKIDDFNDYSLPNPDLMVEFLSAIKEKMQILQSTQQIFSNVQQIISDSKYFSF